MMNPIEKLIKLMEEMLKEMKHIRKALEDASNDE